MGAIEVKFYHKSEAYSFTLNRSPSSVDEFLDAIDRNNIESAREVVMRPLNLIKHFGEGRTVIDLGANFGMFSFPLARLGYTVHAFDGSIKNIEALMENAKTNRFDRYFAHWFAVTDHEGHVNFIERANTGHIKWRQGSANDAITTAEYYVKCVTLDRFPWLADIRDVAFIKMDIEGSEVRALNGMKQFLASCGYPPVYIEVNGYCLGENRQIPGDIFDYFCELGYSMYMHDEDGMFVSFPKGGILPWFLRDFLMTKNPMPSECLKPLPYDSSGLVDEFFKLFNGPEWVQRFYTAVMLYRTPHLKTHPRYQETLKTLLSDPHPYVRLAAEDMLKAF